MKWYVINLGGAAIFAVSISFGGGAHGAEAVIKQADKPPVVDAKGLVRSALEAEVKGQTTERRKLLDEALQAAPHESAVHWQRGEVQMNGSWIKPDEVSAAIQNDQRIPEYQRLRAKAGDTAAEQLALADWCHLNQLFDEERVHLTNILKVDGKNAAVLKRLGLTEFKGQMLTADQIAREKQKEESVARSAKDWKPRLAILHRRYTSKDSAEKQAAVKELRELDDLDAVPALAAALIAGTGDWGREGVEAIARMPEQAATEALARLSVVAEKEEVRMAAADALSTRRQRHFVPLMLAGLKFPMESQVDVKIDDEGATFEHRVTQEGAERDHAKVSQVSLGLKTPNPFYDFFTHDALASVEQRAQQSESGIRKANQASAKMNERIYAALERATGASAPHDPRSWLEWWNDQNDMYASDDRYMEAEQVVYHYNVPYFSPTKLYAPVASVQPNNLGAVAPTGSKAQAPSTPTGGASSGRRTVMIRYVRNGMSGYVDCCAKGTPVWTLQGSRPIESIQPGDRILTQNTDTGELTYKPALNTTGGPALPMRKITLGGDVVLATKSHEFWVDGQGWRLAKELKVGDRIHGSEGACEIERIEVGEPAASFNLVVADFHAYFVGPSRVMVHDVTASDYTPAVAPGLVLARGEKIAAQK